MKIVQSFQSLLFFNFAQAKWIKASRPPNADLRASNSIQKYPYSIINLIPLIHLGFCSVFCLNFIFFEAKIFQEYADCAYGLLTVSLNIFNGITVLSNRAKFIDFIDNIENVIDKRKLM